MLVLGAWDFSATGSPKIPRAAPDDPDTEQEIRDGVRRHRVAEPVLADNGSFPRRRPSRRLTRRTIRLLCKTSGCGTGMPSKTHCVRFRKSALIMTFPILTLIVMKSMARHAK